MPKKRKTEPKKTQRASPKNPQTKLREIELFAWLGELAAHEPGSGSIGLKRAIIGAGLCPMVSTSQAAVEQFWLQAEAEAMHGKRIYLCRFTFAEVLRETMEGE